ncbi:MAG: sulfur carrier protein ThiS [Pseudomonadota bacterium]
MRLTVNGEARELADGSSVSVLLAQLDLAGRRLAVEVNEDIVPRSAHATHVLQDGDRVEIVHAIGGG